MPQPLSYGLNIPNFGAGDDGSQENWRAIDRWSSNLPGWYPIKDVILKNNGLFDPFIVPKGFAHLQLLITGRGNAAVASSAVNLRFNSDAGANYDTQYIRGVLGAPGSAAVGAANQMAIGQATGTTATANVPGQTTITFFDYLNTTFFKVVSATSGFSNPGGNSVAALEQAMWRSTAAMQSFTADFNAVGTGWLAGTRATLLGLAV